MIPIIRINKNKRGTLKIISTADWHFGAINPLEQYNHLHNEFLSRIAPIMYDIITINGDIFDYRCMSGSDPVMYASMIVDELIYDASQKGALVIILKGTGGHDHNQMKLFYHYMNRDDVSVYVVETLKFINFRGCRILCIPELYGVPKVLYEKFLYYSGYYDICLMHGMSEGVISALDYNTELGLDSPHPFFRLNDFKNCTNIVISGHVHQSQCIGGFFYYTGSPYSYSFDDEGIEKGFFITLLDLDNRTHYVHFERLPSKKFKTITLDDKILNSPIDEIIYFINSYIQNNFIDHLRLFIRAQFNDTTAGNVQLLLSNYKGNKMIKIDRSEFKNSNIVIANTEMIADNYKFLLDPSLTSKEKFVRYVNEKMNDSNYTTVEELEKCLNGEL